MTRWNRRLLFGALAVLVPALAGCEAGLNAPTLQYHPANFAANKTQNGISISNAFVLGPGPNGPNVAGGRAAVFLSLYSADGDRLASVKAPGTASSVKIAGGSVNLPANSLVDMSGPAPTVVLTGLSNPIEGGQVVTLSFTFAKAGTITMPVPVKPKTFEYTTYSPPASPNQGPSGKPTPTNTASPSLSPGASGSASNGVGGGTATATPTGGPSASATP